MSAEWMLSLVVELLTQLQDSLALEYPFSVGQFAVLKQNIMIVL